MLELIPITFKEANEFIKTHHRHHLPPVGWKFGIGLRQNDNLVGVVTVGRPVARHLDDGRTLEVTRCCTDGTRNAASRLYGAAWRAVKAMGYRKLVTYILKSEAGITMKAAGWNMVGETEGGTWSCPSRPAQDKHPLEPKKRYERQVDDELPIKD